MMNTNKKTPKLRFKGFTDDWEQRKFGELFILKSGVAFKLSEYTKNGIPIINGESIKAGKISLEKVNYLPNEYQYKYQECLLFPGDIVLGLNRPIIDGELKISRIPSDIKTSLLYQRAGKIIFKVNMEENFTYQLLSKEVLTFTRREAVGSDQPFITTTKLNKWDLCLPVKDEERRMIGNLLDNINNIITLHQRKLEKLKLNKSALLQKLFPQNGCTIPEVRFKGFTDAWEQRKFSDLYEKISEKNDLSYSLDKIISVANMYYKSDAKVSNEEYLRTYNIFRYGEIAFEGNKSKEFTYGRFVENTIGDGIISHVFEVFRPITKYDIYFWKYYINYEPIMGKVLSRCTKKTTMMTNLVAKDFLKETVFVPSLAEQKQIGILLNTLDKFITLHQLKLDRLMSIKKGLLQQLFV